MARGPAAPGPAARRASPGLASPAPAEPPSCGAEAGESANRGGFKMERGECFLAEAQLGRDRVFDHGPSDTLPSVCNTIGLLLYFAFNFTFAYSTSVLFYKLCRILFVPL